MALYDSIADGGIGHVDRKGHDNMKGEEVRADFAEKARQFGRAFLLLTRDDIVDVSPIISYYGQETAFGRHTACYLVV